MRHRTGTKGFGRNFSDGQAVDSIETEKSRIVLHELEPDWWILASIDLTRLPSARSNSIPGEGQAVEYSSREVAPPKLILQHLLRAHSIFLLHHGLSLSDLHRRLSREKFCNILDRFWVGFIRNWDVLLHGNPTVDVYNGIKLAAGGELGIGVGEEEWGSAEREVLEGFVARTDGLLDLIVSRFGDAPKELPFARNESSTTPHEQWLGAEQSLKASDGVIFSGIGAISRVSLTTLSHWMEWIYKDGEKAYGVGENPTTAPRIRRRQYPKNTANFGHDLASPKASLAYRRDRRASKATQRGRMSPDLRREAMNKPVSSPSLQPGIPPSLVTAVENSLDQATSKLGEDGAGDSRTNGSSGPQSTDTTKSGTELMMKYLTFGYGSAWGFSSSASSTEHARKGADKAGMPTQGAADEPESKDVKPPLTEIDPAPEISDEELQPYTQTIEPSVGRFILGLLGDLEGETLSPSQKDLTDAQDANDIDTLSNSRIKLRTLNVENSEAMSPHNNVSDNGLGDDGSDNQSHSEFHKVQVAVYVHQPFIFLFVFALHTPTLTYPSFYRSIDHQLGPLQRPLLLSSDPIRAQHRFQSLMEENEGRRADHKANLIERPVYDLVYDPTRRTIRSSIPTIPPPGVLAVGGSLSTNPQYASGSWLTLGIPTSQTNRPLVVPLSGSMNRVQALGLHTHILNIHSSTRRLSHELERSVKTSRAYWITWMRIPPHISESTIPTSDINARVEGFEGQVKEVYLVRKAEGAEVGTTTSGRKVSGANRWLIKDRNVSGSSAGSGGDKSGSASEAMTGSFDARRYVEALLSLYG
ncbi:MAG: hypothetical protein Q9160_004453 [Pyrenula sp. 1 TL-2023]